MLSAKETSAVALQSDNTADEPSQIRLYLVRKENRHDKIIGNSAALPQRRL